MDIFNKQAYSRHQCRARHLIKNADFLQNRLISDCEERLSDVARSFERVLIVGTRTTTQLVDFLKVKKGAQHIDIISFFDDFDLSENDVNIITMASDKEILPIKPQDYDLVIDAGNLHHMNDLPGMLIQMRLALKPDGLFMAVMAGGQTLQNLHECFMVAESEVYGGASARIHPFASLQSMAGLMQRAGFALPVVDHDIFNVDYRSLTTLFHDLRAMGETCALKHVSTQYRPKRFFDYVEQIYKERYGNKDGTLPIAFEVIYLHGWSPHESQQKPLRPGSAKTSLREVL